MALHVNTWPTRSRELAGRLAFTHYARQRFCEVSLLMRLMRPHTDLADDALPNELRGSRIKLRGQILILIIHAAPRKLGRFSTTMVPASLL